MTLSSPIQTSISIVGRVNNYKLRPTDSSKALFPLFEAVVNSIHSIEEACEENGLIEIYVDRIPQTNLLEEAGGLEPIERFTIIDNGVGFNDEHFKAFLTSDTDYKVSRGGKGIGRFAWLKAFETVHISSRYLDGNEVLERSFDFKKTEEAIHNHRIGQVKSDSGFLPKTVVKLNHYKINFRKKCPKTPQAIASRIIEHCLPTFLKDDAPIIKLTDTFRDDVVVLNDLFGGIKTATHIERFKCQNHYFDMTHLKIYSASEDLDHRIYLFGQEREVEQENLSKHIGFLKSKNRIQDKDERGFIYIGYVSSEYLDDNLNSERTGFQIPDKLSSLEFEDDLVSREEIIAQSISKAENYLDEFIQVMADENLKRMEDYIGCEKPIYRPLLKYRIDDVRRLAPGLSSSQLDIELHKLYAQLEVEVKEKAKELLTSSSKKNESLEERKKKYQDFLEESNDIGQSKLAAYVIHRKSILDLLEVSLSSDADGRYSKEEVIHDIVFPQHKSSNDIAYEQQNLWIVDEKLSFHRYLASDIPMSSYEGLDVDSGKKPDVIVFNELEKESIYDRKFAFAPDSRSLSSVIILEFKRPQRKAYSDDPIDQGTEYVNLIRSGKANNRNGRPIIVQENTPFYAYVICDLSEKVRRIAQNRGFTPSPDNDGYFWYNGNIKTYFEIVSYQKLVEDAKDRNSILFEKLGIKG